MVVTYNVVQSTTSLTQTELNTLGSSNWDLLTVLQDGIGYHYVFWNSGSAVTYRVIYISDEDIEATLQVEGDNDFTVITHIDTGVGRQFIFKETP